MWQGTGNECFETHLIEGDGTLDVGEFDDFLEKVNLAECGLNYAVVSIMGPQSSVALLLVEFTRSDAPKEYRVPPSHGLRASTTHALFLHLRDDTAFERRSGLFAFAVSHIVLINMVSNSVGLEHGASKPLLKHVFRGILRLSTSPCKTTLMFVIRDIVRLWDSIPKPERHKRTPLSTFFNVEVVGLPNYVEREEEFKEQVKILRQRFNHSIAPGGLAGDSRQTILGSNFSLSVQEIWKTIKEDRELDLPKHEVMIANIRCGEIADKMLKDFVANKERRQLEEDAQTNPATGFGKKYNSIINSYLHGYDKDTEYYDEGVRSEKRKHLKEKMMLFVQSALQRILAQIGSRTLKEFEEAFLNAVEKRTDVKVAADNCKKACMKSFDDRCADVIVEQANCNTNEGRKELELAIDDVVRQAERILQAERIRQAEAERIRQAEAEAERILQEKKDGGNDQAGKKMSIVVGPCGGKGGSYWDDGNYSGVREISLVYGLVIDSIRVVYDENGKPVLADKHGGTGGSRGGTGVSQTAEIKLQYPEEFLTSVSGHYCPWGFFSACTVIRSMTFKSNRRTFGPYGVEEGTPFSISADGAQIVGFQGRSGWYLDAVGFHLSEVPRTPNNKTVSKGSVEV
ncbi:hypothetical protein RHMOL_Rhmol12G0240000 [Rhododendron molle]|uniref:Uncharacterized protein n=1 Tax=Rhododendron molle TaxID=49168 RepID=A0ACC0LLY6_RHOML|nr:hypothetical protein RHMOL_Rhmol12G0240000 [Rhododendron molle]